MLVHKLLRGAEAGLYLPFALGRLRAMQRRDPDGTYSEKFIVGGYTIRVWQTGGLQYLDIEGGGPEFEWFYSDIVAAWWLATPGYLPYQTDDAIGGIHGGGVRATFGGGGVSAKPIYSTNLPPGDPPRWATRDIFDYGIPLSRKSTGYFKSWASWQVQRIAETAWYPNGRPESMLTSTVGTPMGRASMVGWGDYHWNNIDMTILAMYDLYYDMAPTLYDTSGAVLGILGPYLGDNCWWRRGAMQEVDGRKFFIVGDNKGRLHVYPAKAYWQDEDALNATVVVAGFHSAASTAIQFKTVTPNYPAWVSLAAVEDQDPLLWWSWNFNKDATKAATIALHKEDRDGYFFYTGDDDDGFALDRPLDSKSWRAYSYHQFGDDDSVTGVHFHTSKRGRAPHVLTPGLVEIEIKITVVGDGDMDFTVEANVLRSDYFGDSGRYYQDAAYLFKDPRINGPQNQLPEDTLVTSELQLYSKDGTWYCHRVEEPNTAAGQFIDASLERYPVGDPQEGDYVLQSDPDFYQPGYDGIVARGVTSVFVIRRQDTDAEIVRELLNYKLAYFTYEIFLVDYLTPQVPTGFSPPTYYPYMGTWLQHMSFQLYRLFQRHGKWKGYIYGEPPSNPPSGEFDVWHGELIACDLRSLSYAIRHSIKSSTGRVDPSSGIYQDYIHETSKSLAQLDLVAFNEKQKSAAGSDNYEWDEFGLFSTYVNSIPEPIRESWPEPEETEEEPRVPIPKEATDVYSAVAINSIQLSPYTEVRSHPRGHFSFCWTSNINDVDVDVLSFRARNGTEMRTSHRAQFNLAFQQARDNRFYYTTSESYIGQQWGSYRLTGYWLPYREPQQSAEEV